MKAMQGKLNKNVKFHDVGISHRRDEMKTMMFQDMLDVNGDFGKEITYFKVFVKSLFFQRYKKSLQYFQMDTEGHERAVLSQMLKDGLLGNIKQAFYKSIV